MPAALLPCCLADIQLGQGLYYETLTKTWRAKNCLNNTYGMTNNTFGLTPNPCRDCECTQPHVACVSPPHMLKSYLSADERACCTVPGLTQQEST